VKLMLAMVAVMILAIMSSAISVIYSKHQSRKLFVELENLEEQIGWIRY